MVKNTLQDAGLLITRFYQGLNRGWWFCVAAFAVGVTVVVVADAAFLFLASFKVHFVYSCVQSAFLSKKIVWIFQSSVAI